MEFELWNKTFYTLAYDTPIKFQHEMNLFNEGSEYENQIAGPRAHISLFLCSALYYIHCTVDGVRCTVSATRYTQ